MLDPTIERRMRQEHYDKYEALTQNLGLHNLIGLVPATAKQISAALESGDQHLNSIPLPRWDKAVGYSAFPNNRDMRYRWPEVFRPTTLSVAERVSLLKHVARYYVADAIAKATGKD